MRVISINRMFVVEGDQTEFHQAKKTFADKLQKSVLYNRGKWQSEDISQSDGHATFEIPNATLSYKMPSTLAGLRENIPADFEWADVHFKERISGKPLNPAPSYVDWPYHSRAQAERHVKEGVFDHTYPERMWPKEAGMNVACDYENPLAHGFYSDQGEPLPAYGIRYDYGDLTDVITQLNKDPFTRQAYLPIWFPEDTGATSGQRVPCTLGYHFIRNAAMLDVNYFIRSCDIYRHFTNDVYLAVRLAQFVLDAINTSLDPEFPAYLGNLTMFMSNLHMFKADQWRYS